MSKAAIYVLFDPRRPDDVRYVGKAVNHVLRLRAHRLVSVRNPKQPVQHWIKALAAEGVKVEMRVIECAENWREAERRWIAYYRAFNGSLMLNVTNGGDSGNGRPIGSRNRRTIAMLSRYLCWSHPLVFIIRETQRLAGDVGKLKAGEEFHIWEATFDWVKSIYPLMLLKLLSNRPDRADDVRQLLQLHREIGRDLQT